MKKKRPTRTNKIMDENTSFEVIEAYKAARTNIMFILGKDHRENNGNVAIFTGANQGEGKTTTCVNLALALVQTGKRVLIIDADMRKPRLHKLFGIDLVPGLSDKLISASEESCIYEISCGNMFVLTAGTIPPNPSELLGSKAMEELIAKASSEFDYVFIDVPPVGIVTDAAVVCPKVAGAIFVAGYNSTTTEDLRIAVEALTSAGGKIIGTILNKADPEEKYSRGRLNKYKRYYNYGYGYSYSNHDD